MRITYIDQYFKTPEMSGGTRGFEMMRRVSRAGHQVTIVTSRLDSESRSSTGWSVTEVEGMTVHWLAVPYSNRMSFRRRLLAFGRYALAARVRAANVAADLVFATSTPLTVALPAIHAARTSRVPMVFEVRDLWPELPIAVGAIRSPLAIWMARRLELWAYQNSEAVVALSPGMAAGVGATGYPENRIAVIPNACDSAFFQVGEERAAAFRAERTWLQDRPLLLYAGTMGRINDVGWLVPVAKELLRLDPGIAILIIGDGVEREAVMERARASGVLGHNVYFEGRLAKSEMPVAFGAASLGLNLAKDLPAIRNNSANKFFDALAAGVPVLVNYGGWQADLVESLGAGIVVRRGSPASIAAVIAGRVRDADWLSSASQAATRLGLERFERADLASKLIAVLEAAAERTGERASSLAPWMP